MTPPTFSRMWGTETSRSLLASGLVVLAGSGFSGCGDGSMNLEIQSTLTSPDAPLYDHAQVYLDQHREYSHVRATLECDLPESPEACLLRLEAGEQKNAGPSSSLVVTVATGVQPLPGSVDFGGVYSYGAEPVSYAATEDVGTDDLVRRYDYRCTLQTGTMTLDQIPEPGGEITGGLDVTMECVEATVPDAVVTASLKATFDTVVSEPDY